MVGGGKPFGDGEPADPGELRRYLMPPIMSFGISRQKRQHEI